MPRLTRRFTRTKPKDFRELVTELPQILASRRKNTYSNVFWGTFAKSMFTSVYEAFIAKSAKQTDDLGNAWKDLSPAYKAYKRIEAPSKDQRKYLDRRKKNSLGILTQAQVKLWKRIFFVVYIVETRRKRMSEAAAKQKAGKVAWSVLKDEGAPTMIEVFGERNVPINILTGKLLASFKPGKAGPRTGYVKSNPNQLASFSNRRIELGTNIPYASYVQEVRQIWPDDIDGWIDKAIDEGTDALASYIAATSRKRTS